MAEGRSAEGCLLFEEELTMDTAFRRFCARFTVSRRPMEVCALLSVPWAALRLTELACV